MRILPGALLSLLLAAPALAQLHSGHGWAQGAAGANFAIVNADLNTETGALSVWADYTGLLGDLDTVRISEPGGAEWGQLDHDGGASGFTSGVLGVDAARLDQLLQSGFVIRFHTAAFPAGEMEAALAFQSHHYLSFDVEPTQVVAGSSSTASGSLGAVLTTTGVVGFGGTIAGLGEPITALELRGPAWYGEEGALVLDLTGHNAAGIPNGVDVQLDPSLLTNEQRADLRDGQCYLLVRTGTYPAGAVRGQIYDRLRPTRYCAGRPNSTSQIGGQVTATGSVRVADNDLTLHGQFVPIGSTVLPLVGIGTSHAFEVPASQGTFCLGGGWIGRFVNDLRVGQGIGVFDVTVDLTQIPTSNGPLAVQPGDRLNFQLWYRDTVGGVPVSNFSDAVSVRLR